MLRNERLWVKVKENLQSALGMNERKVHKKKKSQQGTNKLAWDSPLNFYTLFRKKGLMTQVKA